ncbi:hypothetical protein MUGA111182_15140 [Mucilaginibacter galii]
MKILCPFFVDGCLKIYYYLQIYGMKIYLKFILIAVSVFTCMSGFAQSREDRSNLSLNSKAVKITKATGWRKSAVTGKWVSNPNVISSDENPTVEDKSHLDNFKWMQWATIKQDGKNYYILMYEDVTGAWKYPHIKQDWQSYSKVYYFAFTEQQYNDIIKKANVQSGKNIYVKTNIYDSFLPNIESQEDKAYDNEIGVHLTNSFASKWPINKVFIYNSQKVDGKDVIRFIFPMDDESYITEALKDGYFEMSLEEFKEMLKI